MRYKRVSRDARRQRAAPGRDLYGSQRWKDLRRAILRRLPDCAECGAPAKHVDHIRPHRGDVKLFFDLRNLRQLCHSCHSRLTAKADGGFGNATHGDKYLTSAACSANGEPLSPGHPWAESGRSGVPADRFNNRR